MLQVDRTATAQAEEIAASPAASHDQKTVFKFDPEAARASMVSKRLLLTSQGNLGFGEHITYNSPWGLHHIPEE